MLVPSYDPPDSVHQARYVEVDRQSDRAARTFEVCHHLSEMYRLRLRDRLQLDDNDAPDEEVEPVGAIEALALEYYRASPPVAPLQATTRKQVGEA